MSNRNPPSLAEDSILKRSTEAYGFSSSIVRNRNQLMVEMYIQRNNIDLEEYIQTQRYLRLDIPLETVRGWYPTPNWKKDLQKMCDEMRTFYTNINMQNGDFKYMNLLIGIELDNKGLHLEVNPKALQYFVITSNKYASLYYDATKYFKISYSHELFWQACKHDISSHNFSFFLTPDEINKTFGTKYQNSNIKNQILIPAQTEIKEVYDKGISPLYITFDERRTVIGKTKTIIGWEFFVHNENREKNHDQAAIEAFGNINSFLEKHYSLYHINVIEQVREFASRDILSLWVRLQQIQRDIEEKKIVDIQKYLSKVLIYGFKIQPQSKKTAKKDITASPLFAIQEKNYRDGAYRWENSQSYIRNEPFPDEFKKLVLNEVFFDEYIVTDKEIRLCLISEDHIQSSVMILFSAELKQVINANFLPNTAVTWRTIKH